MRVVSWRKLSAEELILSNYGAGSRSDSKESACNSGDLGLIPGLRRLPGEGNGYPLQYSCLENPNGQRNLEGYSPWVCKESDMTKQLIIAHEDIESRFTLKFKHGNNQHVQPLKNNFTLFNPMAHDVLCIEVK